MIRFGVLVCVFLIVFRKFLCSFTSEGHLIRNITFDNTLPTQTLYYIKIYEGFGLIKCSLQCLMLNSACVAVLYSKKFSSCKLMKGYLTELSINRTSAEVGWEYWIRNNFSPVGWVSFDRHCYFLSNGKMNWSDAKAQCELQGSYLVEVDTMAKNTWIQETLILPWNTMGCSIWYKCCKTWIGATDMDNEGLFTWNRRTSVNFTNWYNGQPENIKGKDCVQFCRNGFWDDTECSREKFFICEKERDF